MEDEDEEEAEGGTRQCISITKYLRGLLHLRP
jgi:hypothetical protein